MEWLLGTNLPVWPARTNSALRLLVRAFQHPAPPGPSPAPTPFSSFQLAIAPIVAGMALVSFQGMELSVTGFVVSSIHVILTAALLVLNGELLAGEMEVSSGCMYGAIFHGCYVWLPLDFARHARRG